MFVPIRQNNVFSEAEIASYLSTIFISFIIIGVLSITSVLPVMLNVRDMFYRHKAAQMLGSSSVGRALATAEKRFIIIASFLFCVVFIPVSGILEGGTGNDVWFGLIILDIYFQSPNLSSFGWLSDRRIAGQSFAFWGFFTFNMAIYSYSGKISQFLNRIVSAAWILSSVPYHLLLQKVNFSCVWLEVRRQLRYCVPCSLERTISFRAWSSDPNKWERDYGLLLTGSHQDILCTKVSLSSNHQ